MSTRKPTIIALKRHDTYPAITVTLADNRTREPLDLTTAVAVQLRMYTDTAPRVVKALGAFDIVDPPTSGVVSYVWDPADTDTAGEYLAEIRVLYDDGTLERAPEKDFIRIHIDPDLDNA